MSQGSPQRVLITGAASGIGRAASLRFAEDGASIALLDIRADELKTTSDEVRRLGAEAMAFTVDTSKEPEVSAAFAAVNDSFGGLDSVVAAAGISMTLTGDGRVDELDKEIWDRILATNLTGTFLTCKYAVRAFVTAGRGSIVVIGSPTGLYGFAYGEHAYSASKAGCHGLARVMAGELGPLGIRKHRGTGLHRYADECAYRGRPQSGGRSRANDTASSHWRTAEVAGLIAWLCSDEASYATGGYYAADGGQMCI